MRGLLNSLIAATIVGVLCPGTTPAQPLPVRRYTVEDGLAHDRVNCIVEDSRGFIWLCTPQGLSRFDGYGFATFDERHGLPSGSVNHLLETAGGEYWVSTEGGVCRFMAATSRCEPFAFSDELSDKRATVTYRDRSGALWSGTLGDVFRLAPGASQFERLAIMGNGANRRGARAIVEDALGGLWFGSRAAVWQRLPDGRMRRRTFGVTPEEDGAGALLSDREGRIWVGHRSGLIVVKPPTTREVLNLRDVSADAFALPDLPGHAVRLRAAGTLSFAGIRALAQSDDGSIWVALAEGAVLRLDDRGFHQVPPPRGLAAFDVATFGTDRAGNVWAGTVADGVVKMARQPFVTYDASRGLPTASILSVFEDRTGAVVAVTADGTLARFDGDRFSTVRPNLPSNFVSGITQLGPLALQDRSGTWWFRTADAVFRFTVPQFDALAGAAPSFRAGSIAGITYDRFSRMRIFEDSRGDIWIGGSSARAATLTRWDRATGTFEPRTLPASTRHPPVFFIEDGHGNLWLGLALGGIARCSATACVAIDERVMHEVPVNGFYLDERGRLWIAADHAGVLRIDDPAAERPTVATHPTGQRLGGRIVRSITGDRSGRLYIGTENGIDRLDLATGRVKHFSSVDGLASNEQQVAFRDRQGTLWFGTVRGLSSYAPPADEAGPSPPVHISGVRIAGDAQPLPALGATAVAGLQLEPDRNQLQVDFASVAAGADVLRYQYRLADVDGAWSQPTPERSVTYARLPPGAYRFQVRAVNGEGAASPAPATVDFRVLAPFWRQGWFLATAFGFVVLAGAGAYRYRVRRLVELERVRTRIASDLHDDIGSTLSQIAILGEVARARIAANDAAVDESLTRISALSRQSVDSMSDIVWAVDPHHDRVGNLAQRIRRHASDALPPLGIAFSLDVTDERLSLGADIRREVFLVFKEALNNAVRHAGCRSIAVSLRTERSSLVLMVTDDGRGFDAGGVEPGHGLGSLRRRAERLGGSLQIAGDGGTRVTLRIPLRTHLNR